jgi:hypothetical protein
MSTLPAACVSLNYPGQDGDPAAFIAEDAAYGRDTGRNEVSYDTGSSVVPNGAARATDPAIYDR